MHRFHIYLGFLIAISGVCAASPTGCVPPQTLQAKLQAHANAANYAEAGIWYKDHGQFGCAVVAYRAALKQAPKSAELWYFLGLNLLRKGDISEAVKPLQHSIELQPEDLKPHLLLATALEQMNQDAEARTEWMAALKIDPHSELALDGAAKNLLATRDYAGVIALLGPQPAGEDLTLDLASAYQGAGSLDQAVQVLKQAPKESPPLTRMLITILVTQARYGEAEKLAKKLVDQTPRDLDSQILYLHVLVLGDNQDLGRPLGQKLLSASQHNFAILYLNGLLDVRMGNYKEGRIYLEQAVALNPNHADSRYNLGVALDNLGEPRGAKEQLERALAFGASDPEVRFEYSKALRSLGEIKLASEQLALYQQEQKAKGDRTLAASKMAQADTELADGDPQKAVALYRDAVAALPDQAMLNYKLSLALDRVGDTAAEREALQKAIQIDPGMAVAHRQLGYLAFSSGDFATAEQQFREAVRSAPRYADAWVSLAATLATRSRNSEAQQAIQRALEIDPHNANALELQRELASPVSQTPP